LREAFRGSGGEELAVADDGEAVGELFGERAFVGDHDDGHTELRLEFAEEIEDGFAGGRVEIAGGLVGKKNFGTIDEGAGDGDALLLAAGELRGAMTETMCQADTLEGFADAGGALGPIDFGEAKRQLDIFFESHAREKVEGLEDHADGVAAVTGKIE
jgi:acyl-CoA thioesterase-1